MLTSFLSLCIAGVVPLFIDTEKFIIGIGISAFAAFLTLAALTFACKADKEYLERESSRTRYGSLY